MEVPLYKSNFDGVASSDEATERTILHDGHSSRCREADPFVVCDDLETVPVDVDEGAEAVGGCCDVVNWKTRNCGELFDGMRDGYDLNMHSARVTVQRAVEFGMEFVELDIGVTLLEHWSDLVDDDEDGVEDRQCEGDKHHYGPP